jgi:hemolysin activation/secretion protein
VRLSVVEGFVYGVNVDLEDGARAETESSLSLIRAHAAKISNGYALNIRDLEREMLLINDLPGVSARGVLAPSAEHVGAANLTILISRDPYEAVLGVDNYGTKFLGPIQFSGAASANSIFGHNERLTGQVVLAPDDGKPFELSYYALNYQQPLSASGLKLDVNASHTITEPGFTLDEFDVKGKASFFSIGLNYPVIRSRLTSLYTSLTFDARNVDTRNNIEATRKDRIRALRGSARLEHLDTVWGAGLNVIDVEIAQGLDLFGATSARDVNVSRPEGDPTFTKLNIEMQRLQRVVNNVNLLVGLRGQLANDALLSSEEFGVGGMGYGRGYDSSEIIGDDGFAGKIELQWNMPGQYGFLTGNQFYGFFDAGRIWNHDPGANALKSDTASSVGMGWRTKFMVNTHIDMTVAKPLNRDVQTMRDDDPRFFMSVSQKF